MNTESTLQAIPVAAPARRARPPKRKTRITIYLDDEVLSEFRNLSERCGTGYQTLINAALRHRLAVPGAETSLA
ncbi:BrnA antitoxin family protein [Massilia sp. MS-15]|uniref:BrnA antitoxin family protein n=1 Tax=Massilia sp. MS-15 TaxID=2878200 RepID=UPI001CD3A396|nr:BrnA antitoxin family protein [Massilia sp. MS-15]MCA1247650.1 BrnA antitoxin family protein [Massilia sp. MS-15]